MMCCSSTGTENLKADNPTNTCMRAIILCMYMYIHTKFGCSTFNRVKG